MPVRLRSSIPARLVVLAAVLAIGIGLLFGRAIWTIRGNQWDFAQRIGLSLTTALEESIGSTLRSVDRSVQGVVQVLQVPEAMALPEELRQRVLFDESLRLLGNGAVVVLDARGDIVIDYGNSVPRKGNFADRDYFKAFSQGKHTGLFIGTPLLGRLSGEYRLPLSRAWFDSAGNFAGVVLATIQLDYFNSLFGKLTIGSDSSINLMNANGTLIARFPFVANAVGKNFAHSANFLVFSSSQEGTTVAESALDKVRRLYAYRRVAGYPLILNVGQSVDGITGRWLHGAWVMSGFALFLMLACVGLGWLFTRELRRRQRLSAKLADAERGLRTVLDNAPSMIGYWDADLRNRFANNACTPYFGVGPEQARGMPMQTLLGPVLYSQAQPFIDKAKEGRKQLHECSLPDGAGDMRHLMVSWVPDMEPRAAGASASDQEIEVRGVFMQMTDITERKHLEDELFDDKERMRLTLQSIGDGVICTDAHGQVTYLNPMAERLTGWQAFDAASRDVDDVCPLLPGDAEGAGQGAAEPGPTPMRRALAGQGVVGPTRGVVLQRVDGTRFDVEETASAIMDRHGQVTGAVMVLRDVTERVTMAQRMERMAHYDALTDLPNRVLLLDRARHDMAQARREGTLLAVVYLDLDGFKAVNDQLGHDAGDLLLQQIARRLQAATRATDTVSRKGGDEFIVLLTGLADADTLQDLARKLLAVCDAPFQLGARSVSVGISAGVALYPQQSDNFEQLARHADAAMYAAKRAGRGRVYCFVEGGDAACLAESLEPSSENTAL